MPSLLCLSLLCLVSACAGTSPEADISLTVKQPPSPPLVVSVKQTQSRSSSSSSSSASANSQSSESEQKTWDRAELNTAKSSVLVSKSTLKRQESGREAADAESRSADSSEKFAKNSLTVDGRVVSANEKGSSSSFKTNGSSSSLTEFDKATSVELSKQVTLQREEQMCLRRHRLNVFLVVHLNANWRQKLDFVQGLVEAAYQPGSVNFACFFFNAFVSTVATFGRNPISDKRRFLNQLDHIRDTMEAQARLEGHLLWSEFRLESALSECFVYASVYLRLAKLTERPSVLVTYLDDDVSIQRDESSSVKRLFNTWERRDPFQLKVSVVQPTKEEKDKANDRRSGEWETPYQLSESLASAPEYRMTYPRRDRMIDFMTKLVGRVCKAKYIL